MASLPLQSRQPAHDIYADLPDLGSELISKERFTSPAIMAQEWEKLWSRVWNMGPRVEEISATGDFVVHTLGHESLVFVRNERGAINGFYNVCPHRGNRIYADERTGRRKVLFCGYHGWRWDLDGNCRSIPDQGDFPQLRYRAPQSVVGLKSIRVEQWAGWIWFNLDPDCAPLDDYLRPIKERLDAYQVETMRIVDYKTFDWPCNWKIASDAFNESYHFTATHPEMVRYSDHLSEQELIGDHSLMVMQYGTVDRDLPDRKQMNPHMAEWMSTVYGMDPATYEGDAADVRIAYQKLARGRAESLTDFTRLSDAQISDDHGYMIFPNVNWQAWAEHMGGYRFRPHATDPNRCYYDLYFLARFPEGATLPTWKHEVLTWPLDNLKERMCVSDQVARVVAQDSANVGNVQANMHSAGFRGMILGDQEIRLRHFYQTIDRYLAQD